MATWCSACRTSCARSALAEAVAPRRVFVGPTEVAGIVHGLVSGFSQSGIASEAVLEAAHPFGYGSSAGGPVLTRWWLRTGTWARRVPWRRPVVKALAAALHLLLAWPVLAWALLRFDAFVFTYGRSITNTRLELWLLRWLQRPVVVFFVGSDARPPYINGSMPGDDAARLARDTRRTKLRVLRFERGGAVCVNAPATSQFHQSPVVNWFAIGFPRDAVDREARPPAPPSPGAPLRVVHSPSNPVVKGTTAIQAAVNALRARGVPIELATLSGLDNTQVLAALRNCDLVLDQLYSDTPMAGLATEAAQLGKPALVGGYFAAGMPAALQGAAVPPSRFVVPEAFEAALEAMVRDRPLLAALGADAQRFVDTHWACAAVAARVLQLLAGKVPAAWLFDPNQVHYLEGCGLAADAARGRVRRLLAHGGAQALQLADKPALQAAFIAWAEGRP